MSALDRAAIDAVDSTGQIGDILAMPEHVRDALWRVESARISLPADSAGLVVAGMGGSAIGGDLAIGALGDRAWRPLEVSRDYALPSWTTPEATVLCASYSGDTEETLAAYEAAGALGARRVVATTGGALAAAAREDGVPVIPLPGGFQPRAAVAYAFVVALEVAALCGVTERLHTEIDVAAAHLEALVEEWGPGTSEDSRAKALARELEGTVPEIVGAGLTTPVAYRWKTQLNENAKVPAFAAELPELDHNAICAWEAAAGLGRFSAIFLADSDLHPRLRRRIELTRELAADAGAPTALVEAAGETRIERLLSLVLLGDLASLYLAVLRGVDPAPVAAIARLKEALAKG